MDESQVCSSFPKINPPGGRISENDSTPRAEVKPASDDAGAAKDDMEERRSISGIHEDLEAEIMKLKMKLKLQDQCLTRNCLEIARLKTRLAKVNKLDHWCKAVVIMRLSPQAWQMIPQKVENTKDLDLCSQAFQELARVAEENKVHSFLPDVLMIFLEHDNDVGYSKGSNWKSRWSFLGNCRLVCKSWKSTVDSLLELQPSLVVSSPSYDSYRIREVYFPISPKIINSTNSKVETFKASVQSFISLQANDSSYNPLPTRQLVIHICLTNDEDWEELTDKLSDALCQYLRAFGHHVWYVTVSYDPYSPNELKKEDLYRSYQFACEWFRLVPNLKSLTINYLDIPWYLDKEIKSQVDSIPFPPLNHLEIFKCDSFNNFAMNLLKNNRSIQKLCTENSLISVYQSVILCSGFPNLLQCSFKVLSEDIVDKDSLGIWELEKLTLNYSVKDNQKPNINRIITTVTKTSKLEHLTLDFLCFADAKLEGEVLDLPLLKNLCIKLSTYQVIDWYKLLSRATGLETITVEVYYFGVNECEFAMETDEANQALWKNMELLRQPVCWHFLPKLKSVNFTIYLKAVKFRRQMYILERHQMPRLRLSVVFEEYN